jgi:hypothetical protein
VFRQKIKFFKKVFLSIFEIETRKKNRGGGRIRRTRKKVVSQKQEIEQRKTKLAT